MRKLIKARLQNPNNATSELYRILEDKGLQINHGRRKTLSHNGKTYAVTITGSNKEYADCRQFECGEYDGLFTMHEKTGLMYLLDKSELLIGSKTREFAEDKFKTAQSVIKFSELQPTNIISQVDVDNYQELYICVAEELAKEIVNIALEKMI
jgi:hypothetical protein